MDTAGWRTGPVAITGASGQVGRALQQRLADLPNPVIPLERDWHPDDLAAAEVVVHLAGTLLPQHPDTYRSSNLDTATRLAAALPDTDVRRVVFLSFLGADPSAENPYLAYKGRAERELAATGIPTTVVRSSHVYGPPEAPGPTASALLTVDDRPVRVLGNGAQLVSPVALVDVVEVLAHVALDPTAPTGTFDLVGPDTFTLDTFVRELNDGDATIRHLPRWLARVMASVVPSLPRPLVDVMVDDAVSADAGVLAAHLGLELHDFDTVWHPGRAARRLPIPA
ncbi:NAD-dependent epimerase/dehydratase family protein [Salsipaludibacter albus]|uniref:NAD-dependent epimerase/dehydratase family protein n=1 Tax=Salsipaludibacter albus TaxID=2849650 RepID=UPI001EE3FF12|nr:NAD-dependent epimerase/dehydratase family protein [Salsipaludibacter albus]MBY5162043.1 NAD-dependent epimerase/dehydratase family protein [Salsipaludibacter albus]